MAKANTPTVPKVHHYIRTPLAALLGFLALSLVGASILTVWANRTLTDTATYVQTVGPVIERPEVQNFIATKVADQLVQSAPLADLAANLLTPTEAAGKTPEQLQPLLSSEIHDSVVQILKSPRVEQQWKSTNQAAHAELVRQLDANAPEVTFDLGPMVDAVLAEMKYTKLAPVADKIDLQPSKAKVQLKGAPLEKIHNSYKGLKAAPFGVIALALVFAGLSVWASVHHAKTLRRMLVATGVSSLLVAGAIYATTLVRHSTIHPGPPDVAAALVGTLLHGLQIACLVIGVVCVLLAVGSKFYKRKTA